MRSHKLRSWVAAAVSVGVIAPPVALAAPPGQPLIADVALAEGGVLSGQVVNAQGVAMPQAPVAVLAEGREIIRVAAAENGAFSIGGLKGGVYEVVTPGQHGVYRLWTAGAAPPSAGNGVMLVAGSEEVVRGQYGYGPPPAPPGPFTQAMGWIGQHPFITAGIVATAIAVPIAVSEADDAS
jgi:hypothetical protein